MNKHTSNRFFGAFILIFAVCFAVIGAHAASFTASLDRDSIAPGESATLSLTFANGQPQQVPQPDVPGLDIVQAGNQTGFNISNGSMSSTLTITFSVTGERPGKYVIPAMRVDVGGQQLTSRPLTLVVTQANAPSTASISSGNEIAFLKLSVPTDKVYVGQTLTARLDIYLRDDVENFSQPQFNATPADGLSIGKSAGGGRFRRQVGNHVYTVIPISVALTATKTGTLTLGPFACNMTVVVPSSNQRQNPFAQFGIMDPFNEGQRKPVSLASEKVTLQSLPLPQANKPANFDGAVGDYKMTVTAGPTNLAVGDPVTVRVKISGNGALDDLQLPSQPDWKNFKVFPPTSKTDTTDQLGLSGSKTFEEIVAPQDTDVHALPEFSFSFFNPDDGNYHTLTQPPVALSVHSAGSTPVPTVAAAQTGNSGNSQPTPDILPIKENLGALAQSSAPLIVRPAFLAAQSLPVLAFLGALIWRKRTDSLANNPRLRRQRAVAHLIETGRGDLKKFAAENNPDQFFATLFRLLQEQLGERLDCPASAITEAVVDEHSKLRGAPENLRNDLRELFQLCNQARYAPVRGTAELNSVAGKFENVIREVQEVKA